MLGFNWLKKKGKQSANYAQKITSLDDAKKHWDGIASMYDAVANPKKIHTSNEKKSFAQVVIEKKLSDHDLAQIYKNYAINFYISLFFAIFCFSAGIYSLVVGAKIFAFIASVSITLVCLANTFRFSYTAFKIKYQKFCSVQDWWNNPQQWFPKI